MGRGGSRDGFRTGRGVTILAAALFGAIFTLAAEGLYLAGRPDLAPAGAPGGPPAADTAGRLVLIGILLAAFSFALIVQGRKALAAKEAEIARMSWRLDLALEASGVGFWDVDLATDALTWDDRSCAIFGKTQRRQGFFSEVDWAGAIHPEDREHAVTSANAAAAAGERFVLDYRVLLPDGEIRHVRDMAAYYVAPDGTRRLSGLVWDVTADKLREQELELRRREAEAATAAKTNFLAAMSHEIRTPLAGVIGMLDLMLDDALPERQAERARVAGASAHSLLHMLNEVLDFSKLQAAAIEIRPEPVRPRELICEVTDLLRARAGRKGLTLACTIAESVPEWVSLDPVRLRQVLTNVVSNAVAFTETGGIAVEAEFQPAGGGSLAVAVADSGVGIPEADRERIFERFVQADGTSSRRAGGTGLGLAIARQLVEMMGGTITVESAEGQGSTFRFTVAASPAAAPLAPAQEAHGSAPSPLRILVAEDNLTNQYLFQALLAADGHAVTIVPDGPSAVASVQDGDFDLVLMDVQMPGMDGPTAARAIRALPGPVGQIPIIAVTASVLPGETERYRDAGMDDHVAKPIDRSVLARALARAAAGRPLPAIRRAG